MLSPNVAGPGASACNRTAGVRGKAGMRHFPTVTALSRRRIASQVVWALPSSSRSGPTGGGCAPPVTFKKKKKQAPPSLGLSRQTKYHTAAAAAAAAPTTPLMYPPVPAAVVTPLHRIHNWGHAERMAGRCPLVMTGWGMQECQACMQSSYPTMAVLLWLLCCDMTGAPGSSPRSCGLSLHHACRVLNRRSRLGLL